jgi:hypothetical protein
MKESVLANDDGSGAELWAMAHLGAPMAVRVAATLRIADHISAGLRTAPELAKAAEADPDALDRLLRFLSSRRVFSRTDSGEYGLTRLGQALRDDHPAGKRALLDIEGLGRAELSFVHLLHSIRTGEAAFEVQFGQTFWQDLNSDPQRAAAFNDWMAFNIPVRLPDVISGYDWGSLDSVVDVGGGDGSLLIALLNHYPRLRGTVLDLPDTADAARQALSAAGLADRGDVVHGSFFDQLPGGADGYLLSWIIHDWGDEPARSILRRCCEAAGAKGRVFVIESIGADGQSPHTGMDLRMLTFYGGKERGIEDFALLAADAELRIVAVHPAGALVIVEMAAQ